MTPETPLSHLELPHLSTLLEEAFGVLPPLPGDSVYLEYPHTVQALAQFSEQPVSTVLTKLKSIQRDIEGLFLPFSEVQKLHEGGIAFFFDARTYAERIALPLPWAYSFTAPRLLKLLGTSQTSKPRMTVLTLATQEEKGMSAALFLCSQGIAAQTIVGGISEAECAILSQMPHSLSRIHLLLPPALRFSPTSPL